MREFDQKKMSSVEGEKERKREKAEIRNPERQKKYRTKCENLEAEENKSLGCINDPSRYIAPSN